VNLKPSATRHATISLDKRAFSYYDVGKKQWAADSGEFEILVGGSSDDLPLKGSVSLGK
jgi:beta-glucosidase